MKVYFLRFVASDLALDNGLWVTPTVDIYNNSQFINYSTYKTGYGLGGQLFTWAGLKRTSGIGTDDLEYFTLADLQDQDSWTDFDTDTGIVRSGRIIDTASQVDLISFTINEEDDTAKLYVYANDTTTDTYYTDEWFEHGGNGVGEEIGAEDVDRYVKFAFDLENDPNAPATPVFEAVVRVEISDPAISPLHRFTRSFVRNFPQWMDMYSSPVEAATPAVSEPQTIGAQFINAIVGEELDESYRKIYYNRNQLRIDTVDLKQLASAYRTSDIPDRIYSIDADGAQPALASSYEEFIKSDNSDDIIFVDYNKGIVYSAKEYTSFTINGEVYPQSIFSVFNFLDDLGMKVDLYRIDGESNENFQKRILDVYQNRPGAGLEEFKLAIRRELDLWRTEGATPSSDYVGATPTVLHMEDILSDTKYFTDRGLPTGEFMLLIDELSRRYPATWGRFVWGDALWDVAGEDGVGYDVIPYQYDATPVYSSSLYSGAEGNKTPGVGDGDDLLVYRPDANTGPEDYTATLKAKGLQRTQVDEYTGIQLDFYTQPVGTYDVYDNPTTTEKFTIEIITTDATPDTFYAVVEMSSTSDVDADTPSTTSQSWDFEQIFSESEDQTIVDLQFANKVDDVPYGEAATPAVTLGVIPISDIGTLTVVQGAWDVGGQTYLEVQASDYYKTWFSHDSATALDLGAATPVSEISISGATAGTERPQLVMESKQVASAVPTEWRGDRVDYSIILNGVSPYTSSTPQDVEVGGVFFPSYVTSTSVEIGLTQQEDIAAATPLLDYGGITKNDRDEEIFISSSLIFVDASNSWTDGTQSLSDSVTTITFTTGTDITYPVENYTWVSFEADQTVPFSGIADVNGPWIDGTAPSEGNINLNAHVYDSLERSDFGIPDTTDYIIQRMEITSDNDRVVTTLDSNVVASAIQSDEITSNPPASAIVEKYDDNSMVYYFESFYLKARAKRGPTKDWRPQIHTGFMYTADNDYYMFAKPETLTTSGTELELNELARQGAPIIVQDDGTNLRQVMFFDEETLAMSFTNTETVEGNGTTTMYASYSNLYDISVVDSNGDAVAVAATTASDNAITLSSASLDGEEYEVSYKLTDSFYVDHDFLDTNNIPKSKVYFDQVPDVEYSVTYETSDLKETSFAEVALNPAYTSQTEGFIFVSENEYTYEGIDFYMSPSSLSADGESFAMLTFYAFDEFGNPKSNLDIDVTTTFGTFDQPTPSQSITVNTDIDGFAYAILISEAPATPGDPVDATAQITFTPAP